MSLRTPLGRVLGLGSAKDGTSHWWVQRLTAVALIPLTLWLLISLLMLSSVDYQTVTTWLGALHNAVLIILLLVCLFYHSQLGVRVIIDDYLSGWVKLTAAVASNFVHAVLAVAGVVAVLKITFGAGR